MNRNLRRRIVRLFASTVLVCALLIAVTAAQTRSKVVLAAYAEAQGNTPKRACTLESARGTYAFALVGSMAAAGAVSTSGTSTFDGEGHDTGRFAITTFGTNQQFTFSGTYTVNPDCTGGATLTVTPTMFGYSVVHFDAVRVNDGNEIKWLITDPGIVVAGTLTKQ